MKNTVDQSLDTLQRQCASDPGWFSKYQAAHERKPIDEAQAKIAEATTSGSKL